MHIIFHLYFLALVLCISFAQRINQRASLSSVKDTYLNHTLKNARLNLNLKARQAFSGQENQDSFDLFEFIMYVVYQASQNEITNVSDDCKEQLNIWNNLVLAENESSLSLGFYFMKIFNN
jgi:hypothetical protein